MLMHSIYDLDALFIRDLGEFGGEGAEEICLIDENSHRVRFIRCSNASRLEDVPVEPPNETNELLFQMRMGIITSMLK